MNSLDRRLLNKNIILSTQVLNKYLLAFTHFVDSRLGFKASPVWALAAGRRGERGGDDGVGDSAYCDVTVY